MIRNIHARPSQDLAALPAATVQQVAQAPASPIQWDMSTGSLIYTAPGAAPMKIPVLPGLLSALIVKVVLFSGKKAGQYAHGKVKAYLGR